MRHEIVLLRNYDFHGAPVFGGLWESFEGSRLPEAGVTELPVDGAYWPVYLKQMHLGSVRLVYTRAEEGTPLISFQLTRELMREGLLAMDSFWVNTTDFASARDFLARVSDERRQLFRCLAERGLPSDEPDSPVRGFLTGTPFAAVRSRPRSRLRSMRLT